MNKPYTPDDRCEVARLLACPPPAAGLHESTTPEAVAADQRAAVAEALAREPRATAARLSDLTDLPASVVSRRLAELRGECVASAKSRAGAARERVRLIAEFLRRHGAATLVEIAAALSLDPRQVAWVMASRSYAPAADGAEVFATAGVSRHPTKRGASRQLWAVVRRPTA